MTIAGGSGAAVGAIQTDVDVTPRGVSMALTVIDFRPINDRAILVEGDADYNHSVDGDDLVAVQVNFGDVLTIFNVSFIDT